MRRIVPVLVIACLSSAMAFTQSLPTIKFSDGKPQIAYRLFSNWADNYMADARRGKTIAEAVLYSSGAVSLAGSALTWFGGDAISQEIDGVPMDPELKQNLALAFGITGAALVLSGSIVSSVPIKDYRAIYADVFEERDPEVQEAMAASVLRYQADRGKERRITSFVSGLLVPIIACGITAGINSAQGRSWSDGLLSSLQGSSWGMAGSITSLFTRTPEERLYQRYLSTRDALYASGSQ
jgi:hypothetical protein